MYYTYNLDILTKFTDTRRFYLNTIKMDVPTNFNCQETKPISLSDYYMTRNRGLSSYCNYANAEALSSYLDDNEEDMEIFNVAYRLDRNRCGILSNSSYDVYKDSYNRNEPIRIKREKLYDYYEYKMYNYLKGGGEFG